MENSPNLDLPFIMPSQAQKHVTHNEALSVLDALVHCAVEDRTLTAPPPSPLEGQRHLVAAGAAGAWAGRNGQIAAWQDGAWRFYPPAAGMVVFVKAESLLLLHDGASFGPPLARTERLGVNADADQHRFAVAGDATLLTHETADHRLTINKAAEADTASILLQDGFSGRAEIGLAGDDRLAMKVSADGQVWTQAMTVDPATGNIGVGAEPTTRLRVAGGDVRIGWNLISAAEAGGHAAMEVGHYGSGDRPCFFDFHASDAWPDYAARFIRWDGEHGAFAIYNQGTGGIDFTSHGAGPIRFSTSNQLRMTVDAGGNVGIGAASPTVALHVEGAVRVGDFTVATLPTPGSAGAGALAWVTDAAGGAALAFCDGAAWRKLADGGAV